jgi:hypothetical protein
MTQIFVVTLAIFAAIGSLHPMLVGKLMQQ